jgi:mannose-6-phosphate isomerase-like protein (cupin superfamily)
VAAGARVKAQFAIDSATIGVLSSAQHLELRSIAMTIDSTLTPARPAKAAEPVIAPEILSLRTQLVSQGHTKNLLAKTDRVTFHMHCYGPKGGENGLHAHVDEDHIFVVLQGEAQFSGLDGPLPVLRKNQALMLPKGCFYSFSNEGTEPLVMIRFGAMDKVAASARLDPAGKPIPGRGKQHGAKPPVFIEGAFFK